MHLFHSRTHRPAAGFTLIELSIVLVIIGLIVGGVLVGQDLIKAAEIRATVGQVEKYNAAVNTFRTKYNGIPGDLLGSQATAFGVCITANCAGTTGLGDGNGLINDTASSTTSAGIGEPLLFWQELSNASLIDGSLGQGVVTAGALPANLTSSTVASYFPVAKLGRGNYWLVGNNGAGVNEFLLTGFGTTPDTTTGVYTLAGQLTPIESYNIDVKLDDGAPNTGIVQARGAVATAFGELAASIAATYNAAPTAGVCTTTGASNIDTADTYARGTASGTSPGCVLRFRFN
jgi:prepilin-type N-terminal cleavage/methylation domain-containing protein